MSESPTVDELKALIYGRGRGTGIKITPRDYDGDNGKQIRALARDVVTANKFPSDAEAVMMQHRGDALTQLLDSDAGTNTIADALTQYIQSRRRWTGRGAVEYYNAISTSPNLLGARFSGA